MSMMPPSAADPSDTGGIPAADPGAGAPEPAPGFGIGGEDPDVLADGDTGGQQVPGGETPFRTPDPRELGPDAERWAPGQPKRPEM
jgi:hypothetical protein